MGASANHVHLGCQGLVLGAPPNKAAVEELHEVGGGAVRHGPKRGEDRTGADILEGPGEPDEPLLRDLSAEPRLT